MFSPPVFPSADLTERAQVFHNVAWGSALLVTALVPFVIIAQPEALVQSIRVILVVNLTVVGTLLLNSRGRTRFASLVYIAVIIALLTYNALGAGGVRSPGVQAYVIFVLLAGLLLGPRAGIATAITCMALGLGLVAGDTLGWFGPAEITYAPAVLWILNCVYIGVALLTMRVATAQESSALKKAKKELIARTAAEFRLERALDAGRIGIFDHDLHDLTFHGDERALAITEIAPGPDGRVSFDDWFGKVHPEDQDYVRANLALFSQGQEHVRTRYRFILASGEIRYLQAAADVSHDANGKPAYILGMVMDETDLRRAEEDRVKLVYELEERVKELRLLHDAARLLQQATSVDDLLLSHVVTRIPDAWLHASDARARITYRGTEYVSPGWKDTPWKQIAHFTTSAGQGTIEVVYLHEHAEEDEGPFFAEERALIDSLAELLRSRIERDVVNSRREVLEGQLRQAQKMDALGTLAGGIAHDFNNILTAIGGNAHLAVAEAPSDGVVKESLQEILTAHERARDLVRRILLFSRREETQRSIIAIAPVIDETLKLLRASLPPKVTITSKIADGLPTTFGDPTQLHQVMMNLGTNAGYAMKERGGTLSVTVDTTSVLDSNIASSIDLPPGQYIRLTVSDTGSGMGPEVQERLFEPFFTTKGQEGTGLGLSVVHGIIRDHGGAITVSSEVGVGTEFRVFLPAHASERVPTATAAEPIPRGSGQHIMYVDDEPALAHVMARTFRHLGYKCTAFTEPIDALHEFRTAPHNFDVVITDLQMPVMSGLDLVRAVRDIRHDIPTAVASGYIAAEALDQEELVIEWIQKPSSLQELAIAAQRLTT